MTGISSEMSLILPRLDSIDARLDDLARLVAGKHVSPWFTVQEAADYLRCSTRQIERITSKGLLPFHRQDPTSPRSPRLYHRKHLTGYLVTGRNPAATRLSPAERREVAELLA